MLQIIKHRKIWFSLSAAFVLVAVVLLIVWGLRPGIDFRGGTLFELRFEQEVIVDDIRINLENQNLEEAKVQPVSQDTIIIKTANLTQEQALSLKAGIEEEFGGFEELRFDSIGPTIGKELTRKAFWQIILVVVGIIFYIAYAFRKISALADKIKLSAWKLGLTTIIALVHDVLITVGVFVLLGRFSGVEIDTLFITALLTILGFSVHDTIVVFDRIRENLQKNKHASFSAIVDYSVNSTLARSINTTSTLIFVLLAMLFFGGQTIFFFVLALLIGVIAGTYSSIFLASPLLYVWNKKDK